MTAIPGTNSGHGHVYLRPDGVKVRCGGPTICPECAKDFVQSYTMTTDNTKSAGCPASAMPAATMTKGDAELEKEPAP